MKHLIISVHGIRTFGAWQERLEKLLADASPDRKPTVKNYKFGRLSTIAFIIPFTRWLVVQAFRRFLKNSVEAEDWDRIDLVGHSFGTHLIGWSLYGLNDVIRRPVGVVLAGSVLKNDFPWDMLIGRSVNRVINDCGIKDDVLFWNQLLVWGTGAAGRLGFNGGIGRTFRNRFFDFGHSDYFLTNGKPDDSFMERYWVPALLTNDAPELVDVRQSSFLGGIKLTLINNAQPIKLALYTLILLLPTVYVYGLYADARANLARVLTEKSWTTLESPTPDRRRAAKYALAGYQLALSDKPRYQAPLAYALFPPVPDTQKLAHAGKVISLAATRDGAYVISTGEDGKAILWSTHPLKRIYTFELAEAKITDATFNETGSKIATIGSDGKVRIWDRKTHNPEQTLSPFKGGSIEATWFSPNGKFLIISSERTTEILDTQKWERKAALQGDNSAQALSADGKLMAVAGKGFIYLIDAQDGTLASVNPVQTEEITTLGFSPDSQILFSGSPDRRVLLWEIRDASDGGMPSLSAKPIELANHEAPISAVSVMPRKKRAYVIDTAGNAYVWNFKTMKMSIARLNSSGNTNDVKFNRDGRLAVVGIRKGPTSLWDARSARNIGGLLATSATAVRWIEDSDVLVGDDSGNLTMLDLKNTRRPRRELVRDACSDQFYKDATFGPIEVAADPLIQEVWDPDGDNPKVCECRGFFGCARAWVAAVGQDAKNFRSAVYEWLERLRSLDILGRV